MKAKLFRMSADLSTVHKRLVIEGPEPIVLDFDDVDHKTVLAFARKVVRVLNAGWNAQARRKPASGAP